MDFVVCGLVSDMATIKNSPIPANNFQDVGQDLSEALFTDSENETKEKHLVLQYEYDKHVYTRLLDIIACR